MSVQTVQLTSFGSGYQLWPPLFCKLCFCEFILCLQKPHVTFTVAHGTQWGPQKSSLLRFRSVSNEILCQTRERAGGRGNRTNATAGCTLQGQTVPMTREIGFAFQGVRVVQKMHTLLQQANLHETTRRHTPKDGQLYNYRRYNLKPLGRSNVTAV
jgi:hypothetical protein